MATDGTNLYVTDNTNNTIRKVVISTGVVTTIAGTAGSMGSADGIGSTARFNHPCGIIIQGNILYIADAGNNTIRKMVISTGSVTTFPGTSGSAGSTDGIGINATFNGPQGITSDGTNLYIVDEDSSIVRKILISSGAVTTLAGTAGVHGTTNGAGLTAKFYFPKAIATDGINLYLSDSDNHAIREISIATGTVTTLAGTPGSPGTIDGTGSGAAFDEPIGIVLNESCLFIVDSNNDTIRKIQ